MRTGYNTPNMNVSVAFSSEALDLRDLDAEDNVRRRPLPIRCNPQTRVGLSDSVQR